VPIITNRIFSLAKLCLIKNYYGEKKFYMKDSTTKNKLYFAEADQKAAAGFNFKKYVGRMSIVKKNKRLLLGF